MSQRMQCEPFTPTIWRLFSEASPLLYLVAAVNDEDQIVGHACGDVRTWDGKVVCWVSQVEMDEPADRTLKESFLTSIDQWAHTVRDQLSAQAPGSSLSRILMCSHRMHDAWARHAGFEPYRVLYAREVR